jgi:iron-sulfur cluster repair protein YtfE (RIC family)
VILKKHSRRFSMQTSATLDPNSTIEEIIRQYPGTIPIFDRFGIHSCCGGHASLIEGAHRDAVDVEALLGALREVVEQN